jgi:hypothetical protein
MVSCCSGFARVTRGRLFRPPSTLLTNFPQPFLPGTDGTLKAVGIAWVEGITQSFRFRAGLVSRENSCPLPSRELYVLEETRIVDPALEMLGALGFWEIRTGRLVISIATFLRHLFGCIRIAIWCLHWGKTDTARLQSNLRYQVCRTTCMVRKRKSARVAYGKSEICSRSHEITRWPPN